MVLRDVVWCRTGNEKSLPLLGRLWTFSCYVSNRFYLTQNAGPPIEVAPIFRLAFPCNRFVNISDKFIAQRKTNVKRFSDECHMGFIEQNIKLYTCINVITGDYKWLNWIKTSLSLFTIN